VDVLGHDLSILVRSRAAVPASFQMSTVACQPLFNKIIVDSKFEKQWYFQPVLPVGTAFVTDDDEKLRYEPIPVQHRNRALS